MYVCISTMHGLGKKGKRVDKLDRLDGFSPPDEKTLAPDSCWEEQVSSQVPKMSKHQVLFSPLAKFAHSSLKSNDIKHLSISPPNE